MRLDVSSGLWLRHLSVLLLFAGLAVWSTYPLIYQLDQAVPGAVAGDNLAALWNVWWFQHALQTEESLYRTPMLFAPFGTQLALHTHVTTHSAIAWVVMVATSITTAHNLAILTGLTLNGVVAYLLAFRLTAQWLPAVAAGVIFSASAFVQVHLLGHVNLLHAWVIPLFVLAFIRLEALPGWRTAIPLAVAAALVLYTDYYFVVYCTGIAAIWIAWRIISIRVRRGTRVTGTALARVLLALAVVALGVVIVIAVTGGTSVSLAGIRVSLRSVRNPLTACWILFAAWALIRFRPALTVLWRTETEGASTSSWRPVVRWMFVAAALAAALAAPLLVAAGELVLTGEYVTQRVLWRSSPPGGDAITLLLGHPRNLLTGELTRAAYASMGIDVMEQSLWLGLVPLVLLMVGPRAWLHAPHARPLLIIGILFFVLSLGPFLRIAGADAALPLPQAALRYVPLASNARMPGRSIVVAQLVVALLAALALARRSRSTPFQAGVVALLLVEALPSAGPLTRVPPPDAVDAAIKSSALAGSVLEVPTGARDGFGTHGDFDHRALAHQMWHGRALVGGFVARIAPTLHEALQKPPFPALRSSLADGDAARTLAEAVAAARDVGVRFIVVNHDTPAGAMIDVSLLERAGFKRTVQDGARVLYLK